MPTVAIADEFLDAFAALPRAQQKKVREFSAKFLANLASAAIHYEIIHDVKDDKIGHLGAGRALGVGSDPNDSTPPGTGGWGAISTSGMSVTAPGREWPPNSDACRHALRSRVSLRQVTQPR